MAYSGFRKPNNKIVVAGNPLVQELKVETATNMYPGRLVKKGTNDDDVVVNTAAGTAVGWLGYEQSHADYRPADVDTAYNAGDRVPVVNGGGFVVVGRLATGETVNKGDLLVAAANGELAAATAMDGSVDAGATTVTSTAANGNIITLSGGVAPEGIIVGVAEESVDASVAAADIMVRSLI